MTYRILIVLGLVMGCAALNAGDALQPEPAKKDQVEALKKVREIFQKDYDKRGGEAEVALAEKLLQQSEQMRGDPAARYVLLREAARLASENEEIGITLECADKLVESYDIDGIAVKSDLLKTVAKGAKKGEPAEAVAEAFLDVAHMAIETDRYDEADQALRQASRYAGKGMDELLKEKIKREQKRVDRLADTYAEVLKAQEVLKAMPEDPVAHLTLGDFYCLMKEDWERGLPHLAKGGDPVFQKLAKLELKNPEDFKTCFELGEGYWERAQSVPDENAKLQVQKRAGFWYGKALPAAKGLDKAKITQRMDEIDKLLAAAEGIETAEAIPEGAVLILTFEKRTLTRNGTRVQDLSEAKREIGLGVTEIAQGVAGRGLRFSGEKGSSMWMRSDEALEFEGGFTISLWLRTDKLEGDQGGTFLGCSDWENAVGWSVSDHGKWSDDVLFTLMGRGQRNSETRVPQSILNDNKWHHLVALYTGKEAILYVDGKVKRKTRFDAFEPRKGGGIGIGGGYNGMLDEIAIFNRALSEKEIKELHKLGLRGITLK